MTHRELVEQTVERLAPLSGQLEWDNSGFQCGNPEAENTGTLVCVDVTEEIIDEAADRGFNLVVSHHPLLFHPLRQVLGRDRVERALGLALQRGVTVYSAHTSLDCAPGGVNHEMARRLGLQNVEVLDPATGLGVIGTVFPTSFAEFAQKVKGTFGCQNLKCSLPPDGDGIWHIALCGGAGADLAPQAIAAGAHVLVTADVKHNMFLDHARDLIIIDAGHYETEHCATDLLLGALREGGDTPAKAEKAAHDLNPAVYL